MSYIPAIDPATASGKAAVQLGETKKALGSIPNLFKTLVNSPAAVKAYLAMNGALSTGVLSFPVRERIAIATAEFNGCTYCLSAHSFTGGKFGKIGESELAAARNGESADPHIQAVLALALHVLETRGRGDGSAVRAARDAGLSNAEIAEVVANISINVMTNYFNELVGTEIDSDFPRITPHAH